MLDLNNRTFGHLTVVSYGHMKRGDRYVVHYWRVKCSCGVEKDVTSSSLLSGTTISCGCYARAHRGTFGVKHGGRNTPEYTNWRRMKSRCLNPNTPGFHCWGGRGIKVCKRWLNSFENFFADMGVRPTPQHGLERKNNNGNYTPRNVVWATPKEQGQNRRTTKRYQFQGKSMTIAQWAEELGVSEVALRSRIGLKWPIDKALTQPYRKSPRQMANCV